MAHLSVKQLQEQNVSIVLFRPRDFDSKKGILQEENTNAFYSLLLLLFLFPWRVVIFCLLACLFVVLGLVLPLHCYATAIAARLASLLFLVCLFVVCSTSTKERGGGEALLYSTLQEFFSLVLLTSAFLNSGSIWACNTSITVITPLLFSLHGKTNYF